VGAVDLSIPQIFPKQQNGAMSFCQKPHLVSDDVIFLVLLGVRFRLRELPGSMVLFGHHFIVLDDSSGLCSNGDDHHPVVSGFCDA
jgi:hypothetical protein